MANANTPLIQEIADKQLKLSTEWSIMKNEWSDMRDKVEESDKKIDRILNILENDDSTGQKGLVHQVRENAIFINDSKAKLGVIGFIAGAVGTFIMTILTKIVWK